MWNDTEIPLAYLITFRCYGTWLHGDKRGSTDRFHNAYKSPHIKRNEPWQRHNVSTLKSDPVCLNAAQRETVEVAVRETCTFRKWLLRAVNVRTNHVHLVASIGAKKPKLALNAFKANATRKMREEGFWDRPHSPWADRGSKKSLWNERSVERAIDYVLHGQGDELPEFD